MAISYTLHLTPTSSGGTSLSLYSFYTLNSYWLSLQERNVQAIQESYTEHIQKLSFKQNQET